MGVEKKNQIIYKLVIRSKKLIVLISFLFISACSSVPKNTSNSCSIFSEKYFWYKHAKKNREEMGYPSLFTTSNH